MFRADPQLSNWDLDDEDLLLDVHGSTMTICEGKGTRSHQTLAWIHA